MNADNRLKTTAGLSGLWDGSLINRTRAGDGTVTLRGRRLAAHLMVQPVAARPLLADPVAMEQGFLARFLIVEPPSTIGTRFVVDATPEPAPALAAYAARLQAILAAERPTAPDDPQELRPRVLLLSAEAGAHLVDFHNAVEAAQAPGGDLAHVTPFASKAAEQAARIAGVLTLWADLDVREVTGATMIDAIELAQFHLIEVRRLIGAPMVSGPTKRAETLRVWIVERWPERARALGRDPAIIIPLDVMQYGPNSLRETKEAKALMAILADHGWLHALDKGTEVDGKARTLAYAIAQEGA